MQLTGILFTIPWFFILLLGLTWTVKQFSKVPIWIITQAFQIKVICTFLLQALFTFHYTNRSEADIYRFFDDGIILSEVLQQNVAHYFKILIGWYDEMTYRALYFDQMNAWIKPDDSGFYNDNTVMIKLNSLMTFISDGYYEVHGLIFSAAALLGIFLICSTVLKDRWHQTAAIVIITFFPSFELLVSGGIKESILIFSCGLAIWSIYRLTESSSKRGFYGICALIGIWLMLILKPYFLTFLLPAVLAIGLANMLHMKKITAIGLWGLLALSGLTATYLLDFDLAEYVVRKQHDFINHSMVIEPGSFRDIPRLDYSLTSVLQAIPYAIFNAVLRPVPTDFRNIGELMMLLENLFLLFVIGLITYRLFREKRKLSNILLGAILTALPGIILIGLISPVLGATMRYRAPFLILILIAATPYLFPSKPKTLL